MEISRNPFDFLTEIQKNNNYNLLFPSRQQGLAIMRLYAGIDKGIYPDKKFKEEDVYNALQISYLSEDVSYTRIPQERFVEWIGELKEYFLVYDEENQVYFLKEYALDFCRHAEKILEANFNPTKIEVICSELKQRLEQVEEDEEIRKWLDIYFDAFRPEMKSQVDFLDRQIDQAVLELRQTTSIQNESIINVLKQIDKELDHLKDQNKELRIAFHQMKQINAISVGFPNLRFRLDSRSVRRMRVSSCSATTVPRTGIPEFWISII
jgi:hypothetical protein